MKKVLAVSFMLTLVLGFAAPTFALPASVEKLGKGTKEIIKAPFDLAIKAKDEVVAAHLNPIGIVTGLMKASAYAVKQVGYGVIDVVTFPVDLNE